MVDRRCYSGLFLSSIRCIFDFNFFFGSRGSLYRIDFVLLSFFFLSFDNLFLDSNWSLLEEATLLFFERLFNSRLTFFFFSKDRFPSSLVENRRAEFRSRARWIIPRQFLRRRLGPGNLFNWWKKETLVRIVGKDLWDWFAQHLLRHAKWLFLVDWN